MYRADLFNNWSTGELKDAIWMMKNGMPARGGYPTSWYQDELERRTENRSGYHSA